MEKEELIINKSKVILLPMLLNEQHKTDLFYMKGVFLGDKERPEYNNKIHILFQFNHKTTLYKSTISLFTSFNEYIDQYNPDDFTTMFVYEVPTRHKIDYQLFKNSKYSQISGALKEKIKNFWRFKSNDQIIKVLNRDEKMKLELEERLNCTLPPEAELVSLLDEEEEYFNPSMKKYKDNMHKHKQTFDTDDL